MNYLSVCSGVEAATVAWHKLGWNPVAFSEIEKFPSEVLAHHYPGVPNLGDMSNYKEWNFGEKTIDLLVGGTPCQSFSVAGLRKGLEDPRGNLALIYVGILDKFKPKWFIWENVPGVLSSSKGRDFGSFLGAVGELGYGFSYRVLDAQNFGVPQRRRRVFVVGHLGDWRPTAEVLFEPESLSRHIEESRKKRKDTPKDTRIGIDTSGPLQARDYKDMGTDGLNKTSAKMIPLLHQDHIDALCARDYKGLNSDSLDKKAIVEVFENHPADSRVKQMGDTCHSVTARWGTGGGNIPFVLNKNFYDVIQEVAVRKYDVDINRLQQLLKKHKNMPIKDIAEKIGVKKTTADHWFRTDKCFAIPDPEVWPVLKELLRITDDSFDKSIMTIEYKDGKYDQSNRIHNGQKPSPTLTRTSTGNDLFVLGGQHPNAAVAENQSPTLTNAMGSGGGHVPVLNNPIAYSIREDGQKNNMSVTELDVSNCLSSHQPSIMSHHAQTFVMDQKVAHGFEPGIAKREGNPSRFTEEKSPTLRANMGDNQVAVAFGWQNSDSQSMSVDTITPTLDKSKTPAVAQQMAVRKLTPIECERLQGFPDGYTNIKENCPDGHRYKAMGNSMAVPVMEWIGKRIELVSKTS